MNNRKPQKKDVSITITTGNGSSVRGVTAQGDIYQNITIRRIYKHIYQPGDLIEQQAARLQVLVDKIVGIARPTLLQHRRLVALEKREARLHAQVEKLLRPSPKRGKKKGD